MADITWPATLTPSSSSMSLESNTAIFESSLSGTITSIERPGAKWRQSLAFQNLTTDDRAELQGFLVRLKGQANRAVFGDFSYVMRGAGGGTPRVNGASQTGSALVTDGWPNSTLVLRVGDQFTVNSELKMVTQDVTSDGAGNATINFGPPLRSSPAENALLTLTNPTTRWILTTPSVGWSNSPGIFSDFTIEFIEVFP